MNMRLGKLEHIVMFQLVPSLEYLVRKSCRLFAFDGSDIQFLILPRFFDLRRADGFFMCQCRCAVILTSAHGIRVCGTAGSQKQ